MNPLDELEMQARKLIADLALLRVGVDNADDLAAFFRIVRRFALAAYQESCPERSALQQGAGADGFLRAVEDMASRIQSTCASAFLGWCIDQIRKENDVGLNSRPGRLRRGNHRAD